MPLITNPDGSHRFVMDQAQTSSFDIESLVQARQRPSVGQPLRPPEWNVQPVPGFPGVSYFQLVLGGEGRGVYRQRGSFDQALTDYAEQTLVYDDYEIGRLPFLVTGDPRVNFDGGGRLCGALFSGHAYINSLQNGAPGLFEDVSATPYDGLVQSVGGFTPQAGAVLPLCMRAVQVNAAPALLIGYLAANVYTLAVHQPFATSAPAPVLANQHATWGVCQTPVDGDSLQVYMVDTATGKTLIKMITTLTGFGATPRDCVELPGGGYTVGLINLDGNPEVFYVTSANGENLIGPATGIGFNVPTFRGKLMRVDLRALTIYPVATSLSFVLYATAGDNNDNTGAHDLFYCNGVDHQYLTHGADIPILPAADRPQLPANYKRMCGGHWYKDGRFYWDENRYDSSFVGGTFVQRYEFDPAMGRYGVRPVSAELDFSPQSGITSIGGPNLPWTPANGNLINGTRSEWYYQYQPPRSETGYSKRHVDGSNIDIGPAYHPVGYRRWPKLRPPGRPGAVMAISRVTGPPPASIRTGSGADASGDYHNTFVVFNEAHTEPSAIFYGDDGVDPDGSTRWRPAVDFPDNDAWCDELDITVTAYRDNVSGTHMQRYTPNAGPIVVEGYLREMGAPPPSRLILNWAADRIAADDLSRPLL